MYNGCIQAQKFLNEGGVIFHNRWTDLYTGSVTSIELNGGNVYNIRNSLTVEAEITWLATDVRGYIFNLHDLHEIFVRISYVHLPETDSAVIRVDFLKDGKEYFLTYNKNVFSRYKWHKFKLTLDPVSKKFGLEAAGKNLSCNYFQDFGSKINVTFGLPFQSTSVRHELAGIAVRNISVFADDISEYYPLYEVEGTTARDTKSGNYAIVKNGVWLNRLRYEPKEEEVFITSSYTKNHREVYNHARTACFGDTLYIFEDKILKLLSLKDMRTRVEKVPTIIHPASQFMKYGNSFAATYCGGDAQISVFDLQKRRWSEIDTTGQYEQRHYRSTIIYNPVAGEFWSYGGYGYYTFKDYIRKYIPETGKWMVLPEKAHSNFFRAPGDNYSILNDSVLYIIGGEGSADGRQPLDGNTFHNEILKLDLRDTTFTLISTMDFDYTKWSIASVIPYYKDDEFIIFASTRPTNIEMVKSRKIGLFYLKASTGKIKLLSSKRKLEYYGSKTAPYSEGFMEGLKVIGFSAEREEIYLMTGIHDSTGQTRVILNVMKTPLMTDEEFEELRALSGYKPNDFLTAVYYVIFGGVGFLVTGFIVMRYARRKRMRRISGTAAVPFETGQDISTADLLKKYDMSRNFIRLFGEFQILNRNGENAALQMTSKNKQVFLYILLRSIEYKSGLRGVTSDQLGKVFWQDLPAPSVKNNRNVNIRRIREAIADTDGIELVYQHQHFYFEISEELGIDHMILLSLAEKDEFENWSSEELGIYLSITEKGRFLEGLSHEWLDFYQDNVNHKILFNLNAFFEEIRKNRDNSLKLRIASVILMYDELNETAFHFMIKLQISQRNIRTAHTAYEKFARKFREETGKEYHLKFEDFLNDETDLKI